MVGLWSLGGLSWRELLKRTWRETWEDAVFGQAARLAFYHFLAIFPSLLLFLFLLAKLRSTGSGLQNALEQTFEEILPQKAAGLIEIVIHQLSARAHLGIGAVTAALGAAWAAINGTWAMMTGLNIAYEVRERRALWRVVSVAFALTLGLAAMCLTALLAILYGTRAAQTISRHFGAHLQFLFPANFIEWPVLIVLLLFSFAMFYRFGPSVHDRRWQSSTPGAVVALALWVTATLLLRVYFGRFSSYDEIYGQLNGVAMLLMWLYFTSAAVLIGGELNSEIEKAAEPKRPASS